MHDVNCHRPSFISSVSKSERAAHQTQWWRLHLLSGCSDIQRQEQRMSSWKKRRCCGWFCVYGLFIWSPYQHWNLLFKCLLFPQFLWLCGRTYKRALIKLEDINYIPKNVNEMKIAFWNQSSLSLQHKMWNTFPTIGVSLGVSSHLTNITCIYFRQHF